MTEREAARLLAGKELVIALTGAMAYVKEVHEKLLGEGIAAALDRSCTGSS